MSQYKIHRVRFVDYIPKSINSASFDKGSEGGLLALSREDGSIEIRVPRADFIVEVTIPGQDGRSVEHLAWCKGRLFSGGLSGDIIEWNLQKLIPKYHQDSYGGPVWCIQFNHSFNQLAAGCEDGSIRLFQVTEDKLNYQRVLNIQEGRILSLAWDYTDSIIVSGGFDSSMRLYNVLTGTIYSRMSAEVNKGSKTMIWSVEFLKDKTIVMGDSLGNTQFWDGNTGTVIKSYRSHLADVLSVAVTEDQKTVYSTGVDSKVVEFVLTEMGNAWEWLLTKSVRGTDYDTRTLIYCSKPYSCIISGGIDPRLVVYPVDSFNSDSFIRYTCLPSTTVCHLAADANILTFREQHKIHAWCLGFASNENAKPKKIIEIISKDIDHLICSAISSSGKYISYSNIKKANVVELLNNVNVKKVELKIPPAMLMQFTKDEESLIVVNSDPSVTIYNILDGSTSKIDLPRKVLPSVPFKQLVVSSSDSYICLVDSCSKAFIFSLENKNYVTKVPDINSSIVSCSFHPKSENVFFSTSNKEIFEFNILEEKFVPWALTMNKLKVFRSMGRFKEKIEKITFNPKHKNELFIQEKENFGKIKYGGKVKTKELDQASSKRKRKLTQDLIKVNRNYSNMMFFEFNSIGEIVIVERLTDTILESLPEALKIKKFGI